MVTTNEDATRILRGMLNIGQSSDQSDADNTEPDNQSTSLSPQVATKERDRLKSQFEVTPENLPSVDSFDSFNEQDTLRISLDPVHQVVYLTGDEQKGCVVIYGNEVRITTNELDLETGRSTSAGSSRVRINPIVNFDWESKYYNGNLLSVSSKYMSYALKGKSGFVLRILNRETLLKALIKGFTGCIEDVSFAHYNSNLLACTDSAGDIFVWVIYEDDDKINYEVKLHVKRTNEASRSSEGNRIIWCPHIDDGETEGESSDEENVSEQILAVTCGDVAEVLHIAMITETYGNSVELDNIKKGILRVANGHTAPIGDIALAPDGSVLATASEDGHVKFWQLDFDSADPLRCLHEWQPHDGKPLSRLIFCDSHLAQDDKNPFWRFLMTGASHNSELKIWCTVTWTCLQTIKFQFPASNLCFMSPPPLQFKASLDLSAKYLVLSDINRKVLYVFLLHEDLEQGKAHVSSVAHFILTQPLLSFVITDAKIFKASVRDSIEQNGQAEFQKNHEEEEKVEGSEDDVKLLPTIKIKLHCINPRAMQELTVQYHPFASVRPVTPSSVAALSMTTTETGVQDGLSDMSGLDSCSVEVEGIDTNSDDIDTRSGDIDTRSDDIDTRSGDIDTRSDEVGNGSEASFSAKPKLIAPNAFTTSMPQTNHTPPEATSITSSSITSVTSMTNSYCALNIEELLGKSASTKISDSTCTFKTCEDVTYHEPSSRGPESFSPWMGQGSPLQLPLPESPDVTKVPFPAFKSSVWSNGMVDKPDVFPVIAHSTPKVSSVRGSHEDEDEERTPTAETGASPSERDVTPDMHFEIEPEIEIGATDPQDLEVNQARASPGSVTRSCTLVDTVRLSSEGASGNGNVFVTGSIEETTADVQLSVAEEQNLGLSQTPKYSKEQLLQARKARSNLAVTPHKQIDIPPEADMRQRGLDDESSSKLDEILSILRAQQTEIEQVKSELHSQQQQHNQLVPELLREEVAMLEGVISSKVEAILTEHAREQDQRFDRFAREKQANEKQKQDKLINSVTTSLTNKVEKTAKNEIRNSVGSGFQKLTVTMQEKIDTAMTQKLTAVDAVLKESIQKMVKDKNVVDAIGTAVSNAIHVRLQVSMSEFLVNSMIPGFEKACRAMYAQLDEAFEKGTQQYLHRFENHIETQKEQRDPIVQQLQSLVQTFQAASVKLSTSMSGSLLEMMQTQLTSSMKRLQSSLMAQLQDDLTKSLQETIQQEVRSAMLIHSISMNEEVSQPDPHAHIKRAHLRIQQLVDGQNYGEAFQEALTAGDLGLVVMVCQACDPVVLFSQEPCPLSQPILLSLIQQLSVNLSDDTELKHRYLEEAVVALDTNDLITREHVSTILDGLCHQIHTTMQTLSNTDPTNSLQRPLKRLLMAAQSLTK